MDIYQLMENANRLNGEIQRFLKESGYETNGDLSGIEYDRTNPDELRDIDELRLAAEKLEAASSIMSYLQLPVVETSTLRKNASGRFEMDSGFYFTSGSTIEALIDDGRHDGPYWSVSSVESNANGYYIVGHSDVKLEGLTVRRRGRS